MKACFPSLALFLAANAPALAEAVYLEGVSESGGWYDVNKVDKWFEGGSHATTVYDNNVTRNPQYNSYSWGIYNSGTGNGFKMAYTNDNSMCWAASAANTLQWWQDRKAAKGTAVTAPNGYSYVRQYPTYYSELQDVAQLNIYQVLFTNFSYTTDDPTAYGATYTGIPGKSFIGWEWWFNGYTDPVAMMVGDYNLAAKSGGGYWKDEGFYTKLTDNGGYTNESTLFAVKMVTADNYADVLTSAIDNNTATSLTLSGTGYNTGHAVTLWGYEQKDDGLYLMLTDSDDYYHGLVKYKVVTDKDGHVTLQTSDTHPEITIGNAADAPTAFSTLNGMQVTELYSLVSPTAVAGDLGQIPEPSGTTLSLLALAGLAARRRRVRSTSSR